MSLTPFIATFNPLDQTQTYNNDAAILKGTEGIIETIRFTDSTLTANTTYQTQNSQLAVVNDAGGTADTVDFGANFVSTGASYRRLANDDLVVTLANGALLRDNMSHCWVDQGGISYSANHDEWRVVA